METNQERGIKGQFANSIRQEAASLFEQGFGYKATSTLLHIPQSIVRDWKRKWRAGSFHIDGRTRAETIRDSMIKNGIRFISRGDKETMRLILGKTEDSKLSAQEIIQAVTAIDRSNLFERIPAFILNEQNRVSSVWRLKNQFGNDQC